jgi:glucoamylase
MWAHAEYIKLLHSARDGVVFDRIPAVAERYATGRRAGALELWTFTRRMGSMRPGGTVRIQARGPFRLRWTANDWADAIDTASTPTALGISFVDVSVPRGQVAPLRFTFFWLADGRWEGRDFVIRMEPR